MLCAKTALAWEAVRRRLAGTLVLVRNARGGMRVEGCTNSAKLLLPIPNEALEPEILKGRGANLTHTLQSSHSVPWIGAFIVPIFPS